MHRLSTWLHSCLLFAAFCQPLTGFSADISNTVVRFEFQRGTNETSAVDVELFDAEKPETVRNFLLYVRSGAYTNSLLHRCVPRFVVQGGGFMVTNPLSATIFSNYREVTNYGRLMNEYSNGMRLSNAFGTIAMAKIGSDPHSASSQWFFNLANNTNLDTQNGGFTVFGRIFPNASATNVLNHFNTLSTSSGIVNLNNLLGSSFATFNELPVGYTNTVTRAPQYRELYAVRISVLNETNAPGTAPPTLEIVSPLPNSSFTNQSVTISGRAQDDTGIARVVYRLQGGPTQNASGTTNWQFTVSPQLGLNSVTVESIDWDGNRSTAAGLAFLYIAKVPLDLHITGIGTVVGAPKPGWLQVGTFQTLTAIPGSGQIFYSWSGAVTSSEPSITFFVPTNATNISLTARFIPALLPRLAGTYRGLLRSTGLPSGANSGSITLILEASGEFTGTILHRGGTYSYTGKFDAQGQTVIQGEVGGIHRTIALELQKTDFNGLITSLPGSSMEVRLERLAGGLPANGVSAGNYTFAVPPPAANSSDQLAPGGYGYGTCSVDSAGKLTFAGRLGDGTQFSGSAPLTRLNRWPIYLNLFNGRGAFLGWLTASTNATGNLDGAMHWLKGFKATDPTYPGGFSNQVAFLASRYQQPASGQRVLDWVHGRASINGPFQIGITNLFKLTTENTLVPIGPSSGVSWAINSVSGVVSGSFIDPWSGTSRQLRGVVLQRSNAILGQFIDRATVGTFQLINSPFLVTQSIASVTGPEVITALNEGGYLRFTTNAFVTLTAPLTLPYDTTLDANGHEVVFSGGNLTRLFRVQTNRIFTARGVTFANGLQLGVAGVNSPPAPGGDARGAGIINLGGFVGLTNCTFTNFVVRGGVGGKDKLVGIVAPGGRGQGAAIFNLAGRLILQSCQFEDNIAEGGVGNADPIAEALSKQRGSGSGGAVFSEGGECQIDSSSFFRNYAAGGASRIGGATPIQTGEGLGGAIGVSGGRLQISLSAFGDNRAFAPDCWTNNQAIGGAHGGAIFIETNATATLDQITLSNNVAIAGISPLQAASGTADGGGVFNAGSLLVRRSTLEQNSASSGSTNVAGMALGGGIASRGTLTLDASTLSSNLAAGGGGAVFCRGGSLFVTNSTLAHNGGALLLRSNSAVVVNATISLNSGPGITQQDGSLLLRNTLIAGNTPTNLIGLIVDGGYNISSDSSALLLGTNSLMNIDPRLGPLTTNGGPTRTMALLANSPARDALPSGTFPPVDQRGINRPQGSTSRADIGALETTANEAPPAIIISPVGGSVRAGTNFAFQVNATGATPLFYNWLKDQLLIPNETNSVLSLTNVQVSGDYQVVVSNRFGAITSVIARLTVDARPGLLVQPNDIAVGPSATATFTVTAAGPTLNYRWFHNGVLLPSASGPSLSFTAQPGSQGTYQVIITNFAGSVTSRLATLIFNAQALTIHQQPASLTTNEGATATFSVLAGGVQPIGYSWFFGATALPGANNDTLTFPSVALTNQGNYRVVVTNAYLSITSSIASLTVLRPPQLAIRVEGSNVVISCSGTPGRQHQLLHSPVAANQGWIAVATNFPSTGTSIWTRPLIPSQNGFFRVVMP